MKKNILKGARAGGKFSASREEDYIRSVQSCIIGKQTSFQSLEAYRTARTNIMFSLIDEEKCKRIIVTSAVPGDGKTTTCINLAITFAQAGHKVLIIDADFRRPRVHTYLNLENAKGLGDLLVGLADPQEVISEYNGVFCITVGMVPGNSIELLSTEKMATLVSELSAEYDYIFIDTPPIGLVTDAATMVRFASGAILVVRQKYTPHKALRAAVDALHFTSAKILGFILNDAQTTRSGKRKNKYGGYYGDYSHEVQQK